MINWNDVRTEAELAQARYQQVAQARRIAQLERTERKDVPRRNHALAGWWKPLSNWWLRMTHPPSNACC